jgi:hypothetical protein
MESQEKMLSYLENHTIYLSKLIPTAIGFDEVANIMIETWNKQFNVTTSFGKLTDSENSQVEKIRQSFELYSAKIRQNK